MWSYYNTGVHITSEQHVRIDKLKDFSAAIASRDLVTLDRLLSEGLQMSGVDGARKLVQTVKFDKFLLEDNLAQIDNLLCEGAEPSQAQTEKIQALRNFSGGVPSVFAVHMRLDAVVAKRRVECQPPPEFEALISLLRDFLAKDCPLSPSGPALLEEVVADVSCTVQLSQAVFRDAQVKVRSNPRDDVQQAIRDTCRRSHADCMRTACARLLRQTGAIDDDELNEPGFSTEVLDCRTSVLANIESLQIALAPLQECLLEAGRLHPGVHSGREVPPGESSARVCIEEALHKYREWVHLCSGQDVIPRTNAAAEAGRVALSSTAFLVGHGPGNTLQLAEALQELAAAVVAEEDLWASCPHASFPCGQDLWHAGNVECALIKRCISVLEAVDSALTGYAAEWADLEQGLSPEINRDPHVKRFEIAAVNRMEAHEMHEDALLVLQRAQKRGQEDGEMHIRVTQALEALRNVDTELKEATSTIAGVCHIFPEVSLYFRNGLPVDLLPLWVPERTLNVFSQQELLPVSSRNRVYRVSMGDRVFAIKEFAVTPAALGGCYREAAILQRMRHPHIVELIAIFEDSTNSALYLQFPFYENGQLDAWVQREQPDVVSLRRAIWQIVQALKHLHVHDIVHSDVKPANILIDRHACAHLADFDVSLDSKSRTTVARATQIGFSAGFAAPELCSSGASSASDVFALGEVIKLVTDKSTQRDELVAQLKEAEPILRPTASALLQHDFFSPVAAWCRDSVRQCCVMAGKLCDYGKADCRLSQGVECHSNHFVCRDCLDSHVQAIVEKQGSQHRAQEWVCASQAF